MLRVQVHCQAHNTFTCICTSVNNKTWSVGIYGATPLYHIINKLADILLSQAATLKAVASGPAAPVLAGPLFSCDVFRKRSQYSNRAVSA